MNELSYHLIIKFFFQSFQFVAIDEMKWVLLREIFTLQARHPKNVFNILQYFTGNLWKYLIFWLYRKFWVFVRKFGLLLGISSCLESNHPLFSSTSVFLSQFYSYQAKFSYFPWVLVIGLMDQREVQSTFFAFNRCEIHSIIEEGMSMIFLFCCQGFIMVVSCVDWRNLFTSSLPKIKIQWRTVKISVTQIENVFSIEFSWSQNMESSCEHHRFLIEISMASNRIPLVPRHSFSFRTPCSCRVLLSPRNARQISPELSQILFPLPHFTMKRLRQRDNSF